MEIDEQTSVAIRARSEMEKIEREAMRDQLGWSSYLAGLSDVGRENAMSAVLDRPTFDRWRVLRMVVGGL